MKTLRLVVVGLTCAAALAPSQSSGLRAQEPRLSNLSTRAQAGTGANVLTAGFVIGPGADKKVLIRAIGPSLANFGLTGVLTDPVLTLVDGNQVAIATNNDWSNLDAATMTSVGAFALPVNSKDSAIVTTLAPGNYTAQVSSANGGTGIALVEVYEVGSTSAKLINISTRAQVGTGASVMIPGVVIAPGAGTRRLLVRAAGPALAAFGLADALPDPVFVVRRADGAEIQRVAGWTADPMLPQLFASVGAFALPDGSGDAACAIRLQPGAYMVEIASASGRSGTALAEIYDLQQGSGLVSLATRGVVNATFRPLLGGFTVQGTMSRKLLVRAAGPALAAFGLTGTLADPVLTVFAGAKSVAQNDDWSSSADDVAGAAAASGAFKFPDGSRDAALVLTLAPGAYTAQVTGKPGDAGLALLEIYAVP